MLPVINHRSRKKHGTIKAGKKYAARNVEIAFNPWWFRNRPRGKPRDRHVREDDHRGDVETEEIHRAIRGILQGKVLTVLTSLVRKISFRGIDLLSRSTTPDYQLAIHASKNDKKKKEREKEGEKWWVEVGGNNAGSRECKESNRLDQVRVSYPRWLDIIFAPTIRWISIAKDFSAS